MDIKTEKKFLLDALHEKFKACIACPLGNLGRINVVVGEGNPDARLMLIGEAPGATEDITGRPFVGRSGKLLTNTLLSLGIERAEIFITNIVKCRPPQNRKPTLLESFTCKNLILKKQIEIIQPKVICTLGTTATEGLLDQKVKITAIRGSSFQYENITTIPMYHPAFILRDPKNFEQFKKDLELAIFVSRENTCKKE